MIERALSQAGLSAADLVAVGLANQRETTVIWDRSNGNPVANAIVWQDTRTTEICSALEANGGPDRFRAKTGLPLATYFAGPKARWLLDEHGLRDRGERGELAFGTIDSWLAWHLTGGLHITDVTNGSRTMLMDLATTAWDADLALHLEVPTTMLPALVPSIGVLAECAAPLDGVPIGAILGDQQAALFGQACFAVGEAKNSYGTGNFLLVNIGETPILSGSGLLTTVAYKIADESAVYALEGSVAVSGSLIHWLRDNLGMFEDASDLEEIARSVDDNGDVYLVPAFSGLFAPHWRPDARGVITGLTRYVNRGHIARAALESTAYQTRGVFDALAAESGLDLAELRVDGGMTANGLLMQFQADILGIDLIRPRVAETTALGAAFGAGIAVGYWSGLDEIRALRVDAGRWSPQMTAAERDRLYRRWQQAVERSLDWV